MNKVFLIGNLAADPQYNIVGNDLKKCDFTVACNDPRSKNNPTSFIPCVAWNVQANFISQYLKKGDTVAVDGRLVRRSYTNKEGRNVYITEVVVENVQAIGGRRSSNTSSNDQVQTNEQHTDTSILDSMFPETLTPSSDAKKPDNEPKTDSFDANLDVEWIEELKK